MNKCIAHSGYLCPLRHPTYNTEMCSYCNDYIKQEDNVKKNCSNCDNSRKRHWNEGKCKVLSNCDSNNSGWKLRRDDNQENKEQEMSYKPTSSCTLKNIAEKIEVTNCDEARAEYFKFALELERDGYNAGISKSVIQIDSPVWIRITKTEKRRNWLLKFGFIEEEISLKPCPFCGSENTEYVSHAGTTFLRCIKCSSSGAVGSSLKKADEYWNTRK